MSKLKYPRTILRIQRGRQIKSKIQILNNLTPTLPLIRGGRGRGKLRFWALSLICHLDFMIGIYGKSRFIPQIPAAEF